jgi:O-antigen ligase
MGPGGLHEAAEHSARRTTARPRQHRPPEPVLRPALRDRLLAVALTAIPAAAIGLFGAVEVEDALPIEAAALLFGAWAVLARTRRGARPLPLPGITLPVLLLAAIPALQLLPVPHGLPTLLAPGLQRFGIHALRTLSVNQGATLLALLRWLAYAAFLVAALEVLRRPGAVATALTAVAALGAAEAIYGVGNLLVGNDYILWVARNTSAAEATGTLVNRNHYAAVFELCLPALLARRWLLSRPEQQDTLGRDAFVVGAAAAMGLAVLLSRSRAGLVCLGAGLALGAVLASRVGRVRGAQRMVIAVAALSLAYGSWVGIGSLVDRFAALPAQGTLERGPLWRDALDLATDFPVAGVGAGAFQDVFPAYRKRLTGDAAWAHAHQDPLELVIEGGLGALVLALCAGVGFVRRLRLAFAAPRPAVRAAAATLAGGIVAILLHAQVDFPLHIPGLVFLLLLVAAAAASLPLNGRPASAPAPPA